MVAELIDLHGRRNNNTRTRYLPVVKHVVPLCDICQDSGSPANWYESCSHDPYFHNGEVRVEVEAAVYEPVLDAEGSPTTQRKLVTEAVYETRSDRAPNLRESPISTRHLANGHLPAKWARRGYKDVTDPDIGLKPFCQMRGCWTQSVHRSKNGMLVCDDQHAQLLSADLEERPLEVLNAKKRNKQLAEMVV